MSTVKTTSHGLLELLIQSIGAQLYSLCVQNRRAHGASSKTPRLHSIPNV